MLAGNPSDHPDDVSDCVTLLVKRNPRARDELEPLQLAAPSSTRVDVGPRHLPLNKQRRAGKRALYYRPLSRREPGESPREQMLTSLPGTAASGQVNLFGQPVPEIMHVPHYLCTRF